MIKIYDFDSSKKDEFQYRKTNESNSVYDIVVDIIEEVKRNGDSALLAYAEKFDRAYLDSLIVSESEIDEAMQMVDPAFIEVLKEAKSNIMAFHEKQYRQGYENRFKEGFVTGIKMVPIEKVGIYIPGGTASYPSTVLMDSIPALIAGVKKIFISTPTNSEGKVNPRILAAAKVVGVDKIIKCGGAQAIAAFAYGTESVEKVDKIVGPGNAYVQEAKKQVFGKVDIDMIAGPTEILVIADQTTEPKYAAADMLSQSEHDTMAQATLVCLSNEYALEVQKEIERQLKELERYEIASESINNQGRIIVVKDMDEALYVANRIAPEHLELCVEEPFSYLDKVKNAGGVFLGKYTPEPIGDYFAGPNHTLPTMGSASYSSALGVDDFMKKIEYSYYEKSTLEKDYKKIALFARQEGLTAHAKAVEIRFENERE